MKFSVVIPTYNSVSTIEKTLESLMHISKDIDLEVIVIDDASTDNTFELVKKYQSKLNLICHRNEVNSGTAFTRNLGVEMSSREKIVFNDSDDVSLKARFEKHFEHLENNTKTFSFVSSTKRYGVRSVDYTLNEMLDGKVSKKSFARYILLGENLKNVEPHFPSATMAVSKSQFLELGGFDAHLPRNEDVDLIIRGLEVGSTISTSSVIGVIRQAGYAAHQSGNANLQGELKLLQRYGASYLTKREQKSARLWFKARASYFDRNFIKALLFLSQSVFLRPKRIVKSVIFNIPRRLSHDFKNSIRGPR
jgi:glycosyltransferase involved in cell wall biosynthesis